MDDGIPRRRSDIGASDDSQPLRALVVDDAPDFRAYIAALTRRSGFVADEAPDGAAAVERLARSAYDLVIVDQQMPRLTGIELIAEIRAREETKAVFALMLTAFDDMETKLAALRAGFDDFLPKSAPEVEVRAKLLAARRIAARQRRLNVTIRELYGLATRDELTGVFNRRLFLSESERLLGQGIAISVILFDLDDFKRINDTFGHVAGDGVLRDVGALFHRQTRPEDLIARYGGDEFVMAVVGLLPAEVERVAFRLAEDIGHLRWTHAGRPFKVDATTGVGSSLLLKTPTVAQLLDAADRDLYKNKWIRSHPERPAAAAPHRPAAGEPREIEHPRP